MRQVVSLRFQDLENVLSSGPVGKAKTIIIESFATIGRPTKHSHIQFLPKGIERYDPIGLLWEGHA